MGQNHSVPGLGNGEISIQQPQTSSPTHPLKEKQGCALSQPRQSSYASIPP